MTGGRPAIRAPLRAIAIAARAALAACGAEPQPPAGAHAAEGVYEFTGTFNATGRRHTISLGRERRASLIELSGPMLLAGPDRPGVGFGTEVLVLTDTATGFAGRAAWTDEHGDHVYSELRGDGVTEAGHKVAGTFVGGTGRYAGLTGAYEFTWQYVLEAEDGTIQGRAIGLKGRAQVPPRQPGAPAGAKP